MDINIGEWAGAGDGFMLIVALTLVVAFVVWVRRVIKRGKEARIRALIAEAHDFVERIQKEGAFPPAQSSVVPDRSGQPVLFAGKAVLYELRSKTKRGYAGTRIKVGGLPIYLGSSSPTTSNSIRETAEGELALTTQALVFSGNLRSQNMPLKRISGLQAMDDAIQINLDGRAKPLWFRVPNPVLWTALVQLAMKAPMKGREVQAGITAA